MKAVNKVGNKSSSKGSLLRDSLYMLLGMGMVLSVAASAEWKVQDGKLREIGSHDYEEGKEGEKQGQFSAPEVKFKSSDLTIVRATTTGGKNELSAVNMTIDERCPKAQIPGSKVADTAKKLADKATGGATQGIQDRRWQICREIVETQQARFKYNVMMSELAEQRYERLKEIRKAREGIKNDEAGKLEENNNRMLALIAAIQIDQQQRASYNDLYEARLAYLEGLQERQTQIALNGKDKKSGGDMVADVLGYGALATALNVKSEDIVP